MLDTFITLRELPLRVEPPVNQQRRSRKRAAYLQNTRAVSNVKCSESVGPESKEVVSVKHDVRICFATP